MARGVMERWYYDSNTLDSEQAYKEIINKNHPHESLLSHLAIGEAYGSSLYKGEEVADAFLDLFSKMRRGRYLKIIENDGSDGLFNDIRETFDRLSVTDAMHLSTAIGNGCCILRTGDPDLLGLNKEKIKKLAANYGLPRFTITNISP